MRRIVIGVLVALIWSAASLAHASGAMWYARMASGLGRASEKHESSLLTYELEPLTVVRVSAAVGLRYQQRFSGELEVAWAERGGQFRVRTIYRQSGELVAWRRIYIDLGMPLACRFQRGAAFAAGGFAPRLSIAVNPGVYSESQLRKVVPGVDPHLEVGYRWLYLTARYVWDAAAPYKSTLDELHDRLFVFGLGIETKL